MLKAILFDLGNTVLEERSYDLAAGYEVISGSLSTNDSVDDLNRSIILGQIDDCEFSIVEWIEERLDNNNGADVAQELEFKLWNQVVSLVPVFGIESVLGLLTKYEIRLAAVSNAIFSSRCMVSELQRFELNDYFEFVISSADLGVRKPNPRPFEEALATLGVQRNEVWFIGDSWDADIIGASSVGIMPIWFGGNYHDHDFNIKHLKLSRWSEFKKLWSQHAGYAY